MAGNAPAPVASPLGAPAQAVTEPAESPVCRPSAASAARQNRRPRRCGTIPEPVPGSARAPGAGQVAHQHRQPPGHPGRSAWPARPPTSLAPNRRAWTAARRHGRCWPSQKEWRPRWRGQSRSASLAGSSARYHAPAMSRRSRRATHGCSARRRPTEKPFALRGLAAPGGRGCSPSCRCRRCRSRRPPPGRRGQPRSGWRHSRPGRSKPAGHWYCRPRRRRLDRTPRGRCRRRSRSDRRSRWPGHRAMVRRPAHRWHGNRHDFRRPCPDQGKQRPGWPAPTTRC